MLEPSGIGLATAFAAGVVSFLTPCVLPLVPGYVSYIAGQRGRGLHQHPDARARISALWLSVFFVLGFASVFLALGASATALGQLLLSYRYEANIAGGVIVIVFGLFMTRLLKLPWFERDVHFQVNVSGGNPVAAYLLGLAFGFGWTPCIGPVLGAILTVSAMSSTVLYGMLLLGIYSLGLGIPFLAAAAFTDKLVARFQAVKRFGRTLYMASGAIMIIMGVGMITGEMSAFSYWLLNTFPVLGRIG